MRFPTPMRWFSWPAPAFAVLLACATSTAGADDAAKLDEVKACLERSFPSRTSVQTVELETHDASGPIERSRAKIFWRRFDDDLIAVKLEFAEPPRRYGTRMLARQKLEGTPEVYLYLPELQVVRRVSASNAAGSMFSTDFSYEDFAFLQGIARDENAQTREDVEIGGRAAYVLESQVGLADEPAYERILYYIERERCVPLRAEFYEPGGTLRKRFEVAVDSVAQHGDRYLPMAMTMRDLANQSHTTVTVIDVELDRELRDRVFEPGELERGAR